MARLKSRLAHARVHLALVAIVLLSASLSAEYALQATHWVVMTDELQTSKLATSIAETLSPFPQIYGQSYGPPSQLYPLLLAPLFGSFSVPVAVDAAHTLNALLLASAAWPAYLLARSVTRSASGGLFAAALTAFVPWLVLSTTLLTENAAYPAFTWALFLAHRTIAAPSPRRDVGALAGLALAYVARTQLVILAPVLPIAILAHECMWAATRAPRGARLSALQAGARAAVVSHRLLVVAYLGAVVALGVVGLSGAFGPYVEVLRGDPLPAGVWTAGAEHLLYAAVGMAVAPFVLACAWAVVAIGRPDRREAHAYAVLTVILLPALVLQAASFDVRFAAGGFVQDRYLAYLAPLVAVGSAGALLEHGRRHLRAALVLAFAVAFALLAGLATFPPTQSIFWAAPASAFQQGLAPAAGAIGISVDLLIRVGVLLVGAACAALVVRRPRVASLAATGAAVVAFCAVEVVYVFERSALPVTTEDDTIRGFDRDWVDALLPEDSSVALSPYAYLPPDVWWDAAFWNESIDRVLQIQGPTFMPFPVERVSIDLATGEVSGIPDRRLLLVAIQDTRLGLVGATPLLTAPPLELVKITQPPRAEWSTHGAEPDGWTRPGQSLKLRVYRAGDPGRRHVSIALKAATQAREPVPFTVTFPGGTRSGRVRADDVRTVQFSLCVRRSYVDVKLATPRGNRIRDGRLVGLRLDGIDAARGARSC